MEEKNNLWIRVCPRCSKNVEHKNRAKCRIAEKENKLCSTCNRSVVGLANATIENCPECDAEIKISRTKAGLARIAAHAAEHGMTAESLWLKKHCSDVPVCACGCGQLMSWSGWRTGYARYARGHNVNDETDEARRKRLEAVKSSFVSGKSVGWSKGLTKETDERVKARSERTSEGRSRAFAEGRIIVWSKGKTKNDDPRLKTFSEELSKKFAAGELTPWAKGLTKETDARIAEMAQRVSMTHSSTELRKRLDDFKRFSLDEIKNKVENGGLLTLVGVEGDYVNYLLPNIVVQCVKCGLTWNDSVKRLESTRCYTCDPAGSKAQTEIADWIKTMRSNVLTNTRSIIPPTELDIYVESHSAAVEYNGLYWHSITHKSSTYHQTKSEKCSASNIVLFHVFEDEWRDKQSIVQSMLKHRLGLTARKLHARACEVRSISSSVRREFFRDNHVDGDVQAHSAYGLFYNEELVAAISLRIPFHKKYSDHLEVARVCCLKDTNVRGAISRLTKVAREKALSLGKKNLMTYVDFRFGSDKDTWISCGWKFVKHTAPRWWWTDYHDRFNRFKFRADKKHGRTEEDVASEAGVVKIYGCSNMLFTMEC